MSRYEQYDQVADNYRRFRPPAGAEIIAGCLTLLEKPLGQVALLDAGCGAGAYSAALLPKVGQIDALDLSEGMLATARRKLADDERNGHIAFHHGSIEALPFPDARFDAVMFNQVLHHLEPGDDPAYGGHARAIGEAWRVLRPGGLVVINACSHEQLSRGFWYYHLIPGARAATLRRGAPAECIESHLEDRGFSRHGRIVPLDAVMLGESHFDPRGPLDQAWRDSDSVWALAESEERDAAVEKTAELDRKGELEAFFAEHDAPRRQIGQITFLVGRKD